MESNENLVKTEKSKIEQNKNDNNILDSKEINSDKTTKGLYVSKRNSSSSGKIKIYKNKYSSPDINKMKQNDKNRLLLNVVYQKNNRYKETSSFNQGENEYSPINNQNFYTVR